MPARYLARLLLDAFDVDLQLYGARAIEKLRQTTEGRALAQFAEAHPVAFGTLIRFASVAVQQLPRNKGLVIDTIADQLARLPAEVLRVFRDEGQLLETRAVTARKPIPLEGLTTADAELLQAGQAPPHLLQEWFKAPEKERPFLMAQWISEGKVPHLDFEPGRETETPGYYYMRVGRQLLADGQKTEALRYVRMSFVFDPVVAPEGFALWLGNEFIEESRDITKDPELVAFLSEMYGPDGAAQIVRWNRSNRDAEE